MDMGTERCPAFILSIGWVPKAILRGHEKKIFILDFFGSPTLKGSGIPGMTPDRFLTAYGSPWNTFLGYFIEESPLNSPRNTSQTSPSSPPITKKNQGVIWGKDSKHFEGRTNQLNALLAAEPHLQLFSTANTVFQHSRIHWLGHQTTQQWMQLLAESKFLIGLGNPLLGPSAIDAISVGCMFLNPIYSSPLRSHEWFNSQHPYAASHIGLSYVCSFHQEVHSELIECVHRALNTELIPMIHEDFKWVRYLQRVATIFS
mmetsp:Transcript_34049/g.49473  ORF Transcript_34049/g.49473 Transcript_34049/m.49473 type:complete len:259 (-) Transcript_34049:9-785(-)